MPKSFTYRQPGDDAKEVLAGTPWEHKSRTCPHCKQVISDGDTVHWYDNELWHTKPCPGR